MLFIMILIAIGIAITFASLYFLLKKDLRQLASTIDYRLKNSSTSLVTSNSSDRDLEGLITSVNSLFSQREEAQIKYQEMDKELKENIANISHDLRTPLTSILGYTKLLSLSDLSKEDREYVTIIDRKSKSLHKLVEDFYDFSRIASTDYPINLELIDLTSLLREVLFEYYEDFEQKNMSIDINIGDKQTKIISDKDSLVRIFSNLVSNMLKHGKGKFKINLLENENKVCVFFENQVYLEGIEEIDRIFERSFTMSQSRSYTSSGLGLSIVKELCLRLNHSLDFQINGDIFTIGIDFDKKTY